MSFPSHDSIPQAEATPAASVGGSAAILRPAVDVYETRDAFLVRADLPGVSRDRVEVKLDAGQLTVSGRRPIRPETGSGPETWVEYRRHFTVPRDTDGSRVRAHLEGGVLTVEVPKAEARKPRTVDVQVA